MRQMKKILGKGMAFLCAVVMCVTSIPQTSIDSFASEVPAQETDLFLQENNTVSEGDSVSDNEPQPGGDVSDNEPEEEIVPDGMVLLKNDNCALPINKDKKIALFGICSYRCNQRRA